MFFFFLWEGVVGEFGLDCFGVVVGFVIMFKWLLDVFLLWFWFNILFLDFLECLLMLFLGLFVVVLFRLVVVGEVFWDDDCDGMGKRFWFFFLFLVDSVFFFLEFLGVVGIFFLVF